MIILYFEQVVHYELSEEHRQRDSDSLFNSGSFSECIELCIAELKEIRGVQFT